MMKNPLQNDLSQIVTQTKILWDEFRNQRIFITGGTGFFGCWLLETFAWANHHLKLNLQATVLTRNSSQFSKKCPHLFQNSMFTFLEGDIKNFVFPSGHFSHVIHAATDAVHLTHSPEDIVQGTEHVLKFSRSSNAEKILFVSSGAIYGEQPANISHISENRPPTQLTSHYAIGKLIAENICREQVEKYQLNIKIARCFAFIGQYLPLNKHFAAGNFIRDGLKEQPIIINSDGSTLRSYLATPDLVVWLLTILCEGKSAYPYNVGSEKTVSILELAQEIQRAFHHKIDIQLKYSMTSHIAPNRYVPCTARAREELGLQENISLAQAINATIQWYSHQTIKETF